MLYAPCYLCAERARGGCGMPNFVRIVRSRCFGSLVELWVCGSAPPVRCVRPLRPGSPMHQRAARAHPVDGERSIGKLVQLARLEIAKKLMPLSAGQRARVDAAAEGG